MTDQRPTPVTCRRCGDNDWRRDDHYGTFWCATCGADLDDPTSTRYWLENGHAITTFNLHHGSYLDTYLLAGELGRRAFHALEAAGDGTQP